MPVDERDQKLLADLRRVAEKTTAFVATAESGEIGEIKFAEGLTTLMRLYWDTADELGARATALFATHPWSSLAPRPGALKATGAD